MAIRKYVSYVRAKRDVSNLKTFKNYQPVYRGISQDLSPQNIILGNIKPCLTVKRKAKKYLCSLQKLLTCDELKTYDIFGTDQLTLCLSSHLAKNNLRQMCMFVMSRTRCWTDSVLWKGIICCVRKLENTSCYNATTCQQQEPSPEKPSRSGVKAEQS